MLSNQNVGSESLQLHHELARVLLLVRHWHPEITAAERKGLGIVHRKGGETDPPGYVRLPLPKALLA